jgi:tetrahydromethanopterin S-methyltransferase subunit G
MYSSEFDRQVHEELKRMRRVIERSMSDYYRFGNTMGRDIGDIVY